MIYTQRKQIVTIADHNAHKLHTIYLDQKRESLHTTDMVHVSNDMPNVGASIFNKIFHLDQQVKQTTNELERDLNPVSFGFRVSKILKVNIAVFISF